MLVSACSYFILFYYFIFWFSEAFNAFWPKEKLKAQRKRKSICEGIHIFVEIFVEFFMSYLHIISFT